MKDYQQIEEEIVKDIVARTDKLTYFGVGGAVRGYITAVSLKIRDLWHEVTQLKRKLFIDTAEGLDLDILAAERNLVRRGSTKAGAVVLFTGTDGAIIPEGTEVKNPTSNTTYITTKEVVIGSQNPDFITSGVSNIGNSTIGDVAWVECTQAGAVGQCPANSITQIALEGVSVRNPAPAQGGSDAEQDQFLRARIKNYIKLLNKNTQSFYESLCIALDETILRVRAIKNNAVPDGVKLVIVTNSGAPLTKTQLAALESEIESYQRSFTDVLCVSIQFTLIALSMRVKLKSVNGQPVDFDKYYIDVANAMAKFFDWSKWEWGKAVSLDDLFLICQGIPQTDEIELPTFKLNGSSATKILINPNSLPYFQSLQIEDITAPPYATRGNQSIVQIYQPQLINEGEV